MADSLLVPESGSVSESVPVLALTVRERLLIEALLPWTGKWAEVLLYDGIRQKVRFGAAEKEEVGLEATEDGFVWKDEFKETTTEVALSRRELAALRLRLDYLDVGAGVEPSMLSLFQKVMPDGKPVEGMAGVDE